MIPVDEAEQAARARAGAAVRALGHQLIGRHNPPEVIDDVAAAVEALAATLAAGPVRARDPIGFDELQHQPPPADGAVIESGPDRPFSGKASPWGVDMEVRRDGATVVTDVVLGPAHEGAPGRSHGGVISGTFDDLMGFVLHVEPTMAFTGELTVRYLAGAPLGEPIRFRAWLRERVRRKLFIDADATVGTTTIATATGIFITVG